MEKIRGVFVQNRKPVFSKNLHGAGALLTPGSEINVTEGGGGSKAIVSEEIGFVDPFSGALHVVCDSSSLPVSFNLGTVMKGFVHKSGQYVFSLEMLYIKDGSEAIPNAFKMVVEVDGEEFAELTFAIDTARHEPGTWGTYAQVLNLTEGFGYDFSYSFALEPGNPSDEGQIWVDAFKMEYDDRGLGLPSIYSEPK